MEEQLPFKYIRAGIELLRTLFKDLLSYLVDMLPSKNLNYLHGKYQISRTTPIVITFSVTSKLFIS